MTTKDLKDKYGEGNTRTIINRAIRAEIIGGAALLDLIDELSPTQQEICRRLTMIRDQFAAEIRRRYNMPIQAE